MKNIPKRIARKPSLIIANRKDQSLYQRWIKQTEDFDYNSPTITNIDYQPLISIIVPTYNTQDSHFRHMVNSVIAQTYQNWELIFVDDASTDDIVKCLILEFAKKDQRITYEFLKNNLHISEATNVAIEMSKGDFVSLLDHDDYLPPNALEEVIIALNKNKSADFIYTNEDKVQSRSNDRFQPFFKPEWNQDLLYSVNYITHFTTIRKRLLKKIGNLNSEYNGAQDWELFLRATRNTATENIIHLDKILYGWRIHQGSTAKNVKSKPYVVEAQRKAITSDLKYRGLNNFSLEQDQKYPGQWKLSFIPQSKPKISILITSGDAKKQEISIRKHTDYEDYEIILVNNRDSFRNIYERINGKYIVILDSDVEISDKNWITLILGDAERKDIGCVLSWLRDEKDVMKIVKHLVHKKEHNLLSKLSRQNVGKHLYLTTRYNINTIYTGLVMVEVSKFERDFKISNEEFSLKNISNLLIKRGYRNLYNPYVKVVK